ncbi:hypothetical protein VTN00DRAFT_1264 [Thermoascus crustaceus]|uniref:uncharacterized protein n=1 Tax=Thermoascus crustaceus TaxID=5088 RepID=UPI0037423F1A
MSPPLRKEQPQITPNTFLSLTPSSSSSSDPDTPPTTIFFISGNPGLISYYHTFLSLLSAQLGWSASSSSSSPRITATKGISDGARLQSQPRSFRIYGASLSGFEVGDQAGDGVTAAAGTAEKGVYGLQEQIGFVEEMLCGVMSSIAKQPANANEGKPKTKPKVILIGHSVGAYIAMEILRRHREGRMEVEGEKETADADAAFDIVGGILLFPTVVDIAKSVAGRRITWLLYLIPQLALVASLLARALTWALPTVVLRSLIRLVMGFPPENAVDTTLAFLKSKRGVRQALHMAAHEMQEITADKWSDDIWGTSSTAKQPLSKLVFYFGRNDHWVAERTRDEIIAIRGKTKGGPRMMVCEDGVPHAFCIRHSDVMARKVSQFVRDIVEGA